MSEYIEEDIPACAKEALRLSDHDRIFLVGHSMGGIVSYGAAASSLRDRDGGHRFVGLPV